MFDTFCHSFMVTRQIVTLFLVRNQLTIFRKREFRVSIGRVTINADTGINCVFVRTFRVFDVIFGRAMTLFALDIEQVRGG